MKFFPSIMTTAVAVSLALGTAATAVAQSSTDSEKQILQITDVMQFHEFTGRALSKDGNWMAYASAPDYGDGMGVVMSLQATLNGQSSPQWEVPRGSKPVITANGDWAAFIQQVPVLEREQASKEERKKLHPKAVLVNTSTGKQQAFDDVAAVSFTGDGKTLVLASVADEKTKLKKLTLVSLGSDQTNQFERVSDYRVAEQGARVAIAQRAETEADSDQKSDEESDEKEEALLSLTVLNTENGSSLQLLDKVAEVADFSFHEQGKQLAIVAAAEADKFAVYHWQFGQQQASTLDAKRADYELTKHSKVTFSDDGQRLFVGHQQVADAPNNELEKPEDVADLFNLERLTNDRGLQVWHGSDQRIKPHEKESYSDRQKETYLGVYHLNEGFVALADERVESVEPTDNKHAVLGRDADPYLRAITWDGFFSDVYHLDLDSGEQQLVASKMSWGHDVELSPNGRYVAYYQNGQLWLYDAEQEQRRQMATDILISWADEEHDRPSAPDGYGIAGWLDDNSAFLAYDKYDVWKVSLNGSAVNLTGNGRTDEIRYRLVQTDDNALAFPAKQSLMLEGFDQTNKTNGIYRLTGQGIEPLLTADKTRFHFVEQAENADSWLLTRENFQQFPDLFVASQWSANNSVTAQQATELNPQIDDFKWGTTELISWRSTRGDPLEGVVIKPEDYDPNKQYPVLVYYYEKFAQRLNQFNQMKVNHRPNFPFYVSNDYVVFLPDVHFSPGEPGSSATDSLVPGVQKLIDMGIADPDAVGLHGHSWSGYQSVHVITQTDIFAAAVAGAPVVNMTSAYNGIRWGSGLARQFQYEQGQSRIGKSMDEALNLYLENSPVFYADRINTPLVIQFGDDDGAVPWEQGIEMYLAMRRLNKPIVMLQYEGEPHHLQQYANKVDYTIKMKAFFDHYLKGEDAPLWWSEGMPYNETSE
ncbi:Prolyl oligopeptidase family protein [Pseudidiomarina planktonica]|uniref:Prolyl oligopeptidase family protein n=1 Tax=Pseudidiomarina planktonica TaxID=1323738 RepID=A0A1Y6ENF8_9GAMM|nr:prolyl oligopeptidase family serine peptidase [Pseudidiomarina planktonica]RUO65599.1 S9 family peptidase [Pseudidiomarina planktonica]SMQ64188.1 Prolyl oligopeptidase family protein [Pseudidiomarina planktonica]